ncbi:MAG TPA: hypothetical protein VK892_09360, partial [Pyrinomonadaceae bacterium]|nr:hypothetical protein [Pyrinomonadaceae bacterium]
LICVPAAQCAYLNQWLAAAKVEDLNEQVKPGKTISSPPAITSPPDGNELKLYVVLCYRDCPTDEVPIPGEPCRNENELTAPSRIKDDFSLELRFEPPKQPEEEAVRRYVEWLKQIEISDTVSSTPIEDFFQTIRNEFLPSSPPLISSPTVLQINSGDVCEYMRAAFRLWVTELRNALSDRETGCAVEMTGGEKLEDCVLLAELRVPLESLSPGWKVSDTEETEINEENRPFLLHLRMLQEWMLCGCQCQPGSVSPITSPSVVIPPVTSPPISAPHEHSLDSLSDVVVPSPSEGQILVFRGGEWIAEDSTGNTSAPIALDDLTDVTVPSPDEGQILIFKGGEWIAENPAPSEPVSIALDDLTDVVAPSPAEGQTLIFRGNEWVSEIPAAIDHGSLNGLGDDDHPQYLLTDGSRAMAGSLNMGGNRVRNLAAASANGQAVIFQQAIKQNDAAGGDLGGTYPAPIVVGLQKKPIAEVEPNVGDVLVCSEESGKKFWTPKPQAVEAKPFMILPLATINRVSRRLYEVWFNIDAPDNLAQIKELRGLEVFSETDTASPFLKDITIIAINPGPRNVFDVELKTETRFMRFKFLLPEIEVASHSMNLAEYAEKNSIKFTGFNIERDKFATIFVQVPRDQF